MPGYLLAAQCAQPCTLPSRLPFYFGVVIVAVWLVGVAAVLLIGRYLLLSRLSRRQRSVAHRRTLDATFAGRDIEPW